jgi:aryl-alcohol dehydrogenase-like predicted oxidoreductase
MKRKMSRKKFLSTTVAGLTGIRLLSQIPDDRKVDVFQRRYIGKTGILVSPICLGASRTNAESIIKYTIDNGINLLDTGRSYSNGNNEKLVGKVISGIRNKMVIQSKIKLEHYELPSGGKGKTGADEIRNALSKKLEASLKALNTDYIDILLYHNASSEDLLFHSEVMKFFDGMKSSGAISAHGFSAHNEFMNLHERNNRELFYDIIMVPFNHKGSLVHSVTGRFSEWDQDRLVSILTEAGSKGIGIVAMKTCSGGKYSPSPGVEPNYREAVRWVIQHSFISTASVAMVNFEQVNEHLQLLS